MAGGIGGAVGSTVVGGGSPGTVNALLSAIGGQESGSPAAGGYGAVNKDSGAAGRYGIMPGNWSSWAIPQGLPADAPQTSQNQEIVARNQVSVYLKDGNGDPGYVAVAWYAGEKSAAAYAADPTNLKWQKPQAGGNPSIASYAQSVVGKMNTATTVPGQTPSGTMKTSAVPGQVGNLTPAGGTVGGPTTPTLAQAADAAAADGTPPSGTIHVGQNTAGERFRSGLDSTAQGQSTLPAAGVPTATPIVDQPTPPGAATSTQPTPAQLVPTSEGVYTQVNPTADIAEQLRQANPQVAGAHDIAAVLDSLRQLFHG